jgi:hypothetical protein
MRKLSVLDVCRLSHSRLQFDRGELHVTWEEGTWAAWLYDLLKPHVAKLVVSQQCVAGVCLRQRFQTIELWQPLERFFINGSISQLSR